MIEVVKAGLYSSIQDLGRFGLRHLGVPVSGAMDQISAKRANLILGNAENDAVLEMTLVGPTLKFYESALIAFAGANFKAFLNNERIDLTHPMVIPAHSQLVFETATSGARGYLAVKGGFQTEKILGSRSFFSPLTASNVLKKEDEIPFVPHSLQVSGKFSKLKTQEKFWGHTTLDVYKGPEFESLPEQLQSDLMAMEFKVSSLNNRMAYQLEPLFPNKVPSIVTGPVLPGTVQLTPKGKLIVLMRDAQTTGGYPRVLQLTEFAVNQMSQKKTGESIFLKMKE